MATRTWNKDRAIKRIDAKIAELPLKDIEIKEYVRETDLGNLPSNVAYRVNGVHLYADILNMKDMLNVTDVEGETCHRRTLRFLNLHYRAMHRTIQRVDTVFVDFHNQRLHTVVTKPYDAETDRVHRAVAMGQLIIDVLAQTGEDADHPAAKVRVGIDTGQALAVNNGRRGHREPLFLGEPANHAAKRASGGTATGIFLTNKARKAIGLPEAANENATPLTADQVKTSQDKAKLDVTADQIVKEWKDDLENNPIGTFGFFRTYATVQYARYRILVGQEFPPAGCYDCLRRYRQLHELRGQEYYDGQQRKACCSCAACPAQRIGRRVVHGVRRPKGAVYR